MKRMNTMYLAAKGRIGSLEADSRGFRPISASSRPKAHFDIAFIFLLFKGVMAETEGGGGNMGTEKEKEKQEPITGIKCVSIVVR